MTRLHSGWRRVGSGPNQSAGIGPEYFTDAAQAANQSGRVLLILWVYKNGVLGHLRVVKGLGPGLDEKAIARQYRFKPGMKAAKPVIVELTIEIAFQS